MKTLTFFLALICLFYSCKSKTEKLKEDLIPILKNEAIISGIPKVDSINIYKIDTISDSLYYILRTNGLSNSLKYYLDRGNYYIDRTKDLQNQAKESYNNAHMELYTPDEAQFRQSQMDTYKQRLDESEEYQNQAKKYSDTINLIVAEIKNIEKMQSDKKLKKDNFLGYFVKFKLFGAHKDNSEVRIDSAELCVSPKFRIMQLDKL